MAYIKYKELTKYFNFEEEVDVTTLPKYVTDYISDKERAYSAYRNSRDYAVFTDKKMVLFDKTPFTTEKKIHIIPYSSISTSAISFGLTKANILMSLDSGYPMKISFVKMNDAKKTHLKNLYVLMMDHRVNH